MIFYLYAREKVYVKTLDCIKESRATIFLTEKRKIIKQSKINEHETPLDEILYDQFAVGENLDKQSRASTRKSRTKTSYVF